MRILIIISQANNCNTNPNLPHLLGVANDLFNTLDTLDKTCDVLVIGAPTNDFLEHISLSKIVNEVNVFNEESGLAENIAPVIADLNKNYSHVIMGADSFGKNLLPRVAGILETPQVSEIVEVVAADTFKRFIYTGNVLLTLQVKSPLKLLTVRTNNFKVYAETKDIASNIKVITSQFAPNPHIKKIGTQVIDSIDLSNAKVIVSGGRSLGSKDDFDNLLRPLAQKLNAGVGATRAAVDAGYAHNDCQIGQTGKIVAPNVYLAIGISGAAQHIAGMKDSKTVIAVNNDPNSPIFEHSDYGLVTDLFDFLPEITNKV